MKKRLIKGTITLLAILLTYLIIDNMFFPTSISYSEKYHNDMISVKDNVIYIDYNMANLFLEDVSGYINYNNDLSKIYNNIIDKYFKKKNIKCYEENKYQVLEIKYKKKEAKELFSKYIKVDKDIIVKVLFNKNWNLKNIDIASVDYKINREEIIRNNVVNVAKNEIGNPGSKYWQWYGVNYHMEWCCVFVSYVANQSNVMETYIPRFGGVSAGIRYFKSKDQFKYKSEYTPKKGDVIFFDFPSEHVVDHVGIVEKVENGMVYTIEGNANSNYVKNKEYPLDSPYIYAYGAPDYGTVR